MKAKKAVKRIKKNFVELEVDGIVQLSFPVDLSALEGLNRKELDKTYITLANPINSKQKIQFKLNSKCLNIIKNGDASIIYDVVGINDIEFPELVDDKTMKSAEIDFEMMEN